MSKKFSVHINAWSQGKSILPKFAFGRPGDKTPFAVSDNISPAISWSNASAGSRSFVILSYDPDSHS